MGAVHGLTASMGPAWAWAASRPPSAAVPRRRDHGGTTRHGRDRRRRLGAGHRPHRADQGLRTLLPRVGLGTAGHGHRLRTRSGLGGRAHAPDARTGLGRVLAKRRRPLRDHPARARRRDRDPVVKRRLVLCAAIVGGLLAAGCGIPTQQQPSAVSSSRVPPGLVSPNLPSTSTTQPRASVNVTIYLLGPTEGLVPRQRVVQIPAPLKSILTALFAGPDQVRGSSSASAPRSQPMWRCSPSPPRVRWSP